MKFFTIFFILSIHLIGTYMTLVHGSSDSTLIKDILTKSDSGQQPSVLANGGTEPEWSDYIKAKEYLEKRDSENWFAKENFYDPQQLSERSAELQQQQYRSYNSYLPPAAPVVPCGRSLLFSCQPSVSAVPCLAPLPSIPYRRSVDPSSYGPQIDGASSEHYPAYSMMPYSQGLINQRGFYKPNYYYGNY